jgi:AraC-like DNA-binding protein
VLLRDYQPDPVLLELVKCYRVVHFSFDASVQSIPPKPYTPRPENCLVFYPRDREKVVFADSGKSAAQIPVVLYGQHLHTNLRYVGHEFLVLQVHFQPGALYRLTGIPLYELNNVYMDADQVWGTGLHLVNEQLFHAKSYAEMVGILNRFLLPLAKKVQKDRHLLDDAMLLLFQRNGAVNLDWLCREACLSVKQLERKFKERAGINPKVFQRLIRFDRAFRTKNAKPELDWVSLAYQCDYYDYQHLVRDFKDFTGLSPNAFLALESQAPERAFGLAEQFYEKTF